eukprot:3191284-Pyramimonas_sp.AAC.1
MLNAEGVAELVVLEDEAVRVEATTVRGLFPDAPGEVPGVLVLDAAHHLGATRGGGMGGGGAGGRGRGG